jgi:hypothetical protein
LAKLLDFLFLLCSYLCILSIYSETMQLIMRRLHPRGAANRGICVDALGAMLGPNCVLVRRTLRGFRGIERDRADALQKCALVEGRDRDLLFRQSQRIAEALDKGEIALAQIYGLHIPVIDLDDRRLARISQIGFVRGYDPDEPRIPKGDPQGAEWTTGATSDAATGVSRDGAVGSGDSGEGDGSSEGGSDDDKGGGGAGDDGEGGSPPATGGAPFSPTEAAAASGDQGNGGGIPPANQPPIIFKWPDYGGLSPRDYLRGKSWEEQYEIGLKALRRFGVLK